MYAPVVPSNQKRPKNPNLWGGTYLYSLYEGVPPGPDPFYDYWDRVGRSKNGCRKQHLGQARDSENRATQTSANDFYEYL